MSAFEQVLTATTAAVTVPARSYVDAESIVVTAPGLATTETVTVAVVGAFGAINLYGAGATPFLYQLTATAQALVVPGGYSYSFIKSATVAAVPIEVHTRPRPL